MYFPEFLDRFVEFDREEGELFDVVWYHNKKQRSPMNTTTNASEKNQIRMVKNALESENLLEIFS